MVSAMVRVRIAMRHRAIPLLRRTDQCVPIMFTNQRESAGTGLKRARFAGAAYSGNPQLLMVEGGMKVTFRVQEKHEPIWIVRKIPHTA